MGKSILAFVVTMVVGIWFTSIGETMNWPEFGNLIAVAVMGAFIIYFNNKKDKS